MIIKSQHSPNFSKNLRKNQDINFIIIHYTGMQSRIAAIKRLLNPKSKVSCHFFIDRKGKISKMVDENKVAWHAGKSKWKNFKNLNNSSIGIELVNRGFEFGYENYTNSQIKKLIELCLILKKRFKIKNSNIIGHSDIAPLRKQDPGEKFPWLKLKKNNLGIWYEPIHFNKKIDKKKLPELFFKNLFKIGYRYFNRKKRGINDYLVVKKKFKIKNSNILGHSDIAPIRKLDPGEKFPWKRLNKNQLGIWCKPRRVKAQKISSKKMIKLFFKNLFKIGYRYFDLQKRKKKDIFLIKTFQRRFLPHNVNGKIDKKTYIISHFLANNSKN